MMRPLASLLLPLAVLVACAGGSANPTTQPSIGPDALSIEANGLAFSTRSLTAPADKPFQIVFDNRDPPSTTSRSTANRPLPRVAGTRSTAPPSVTTYRPWDGPILPRCPSDAGGSLTVG
jgi:hypothetical protein